MEDRLVLSWAGVPPETISPPSSFKSITLNSDADATGRTSIRRTEVDYFRFTATRTGDYTISALTPSSSLDTVLGVFDASGNRIAYNDDISSTNTDSEVIVHLQSGSRYFFGITNYTGTKGGKYTWIVDGPTAVLPPATDDAFEDNDTMATATDLGSLTTVRTLTALQLRDEDWFRFSQPGVGGTSDYVSINFNHSEGDLDLYVYNSQGSLVGSSTGTTNTEQVSLNGLGSGTYYVWVHGYNGAQSSNYTLTIDPGTTSAPPPQSGTFNITLSLSGFTSSQTAIFQQAANRWEEIITADLPNATYNGLSVDDILIDGRSVSIDGRGGVLGRAGPDRLRSGSYLPYHGIMEFDSADVAAMESNGQLFSVIVHEMGHVLGIGTIWSYLGLVSGAGGSNPRFVGMQATAAYNEIFARSESSVPVESGGGSGTRDAHWRESVFGNEIMTGWISSGANPISRVTVASLADMGYIVNLNAADTYYPPGTSSSAQSSSGGTSGGASLWESSRFHSLDNWREIVGALIEGRNGDRENWWRTADALFAAYAA